MGQVSIKTTSGADLGSRIAGPSSSIRRLVARASRRLATIAITLAVIFGFWWAVIAFYDIKPYFMPGPGATLSTLVEQRGTLIGHARVTLWESAVGVIAALILAVFLATVFVTSPTMERALLPMAIVFRSIPIVAIAPLITLIAGRGFATSVVCVTIVSFFPILVNTARGLRSLSPEMRELFRVCGASRRQLFRSARVPLMLPFLFAGLRSAAAVAVLGAMLAEWLTGQQGLGYLLTNAAALRDNELLWSVAIVASALSLGVFAVTQIIERRLVAWAKGVSV